MSQHSTGPGALGRGLNCGTRRQPVLGRNLGRSVVPIVGAYSSRASEAFWISDGSHFTTANLLIHVKIQAGPASSAEQFCMWAGMAEAGGNAQQVTRDKGDLHLRLHLSRAMGTCIGSSLDLCLQLTRAESPPRPHWLQHSSTLRQGSGCGEGKTQTYRDQSHLGPNIRFLLQQLGITPHPQ